MIAFAIRWLSSKKVRVATQMRHHVWKYTNAQRDLLSDEAIGHLEDSMQRVRQAIVQPENPTSLEEALNHLEKTANKWLKPYPNASIRENIEVFLVAAAVVLAFRSFFFQPMAIPTGSAQPAFWGITHEDLRGQPESAIPGGLKKYYFSWIKGEKYYHLKAKTSGTLRLLDPKPVRVIPWSPNSGCRSETNDTPFGSHPKISGIEPVCEVV